MLVPILTERNEVLASSIVAACESAELGDGAVVAVLGMAHCNGVRRAIEEGRPALGL